ncbi:unknown protein [Seminavis robusta]|uniref:Uncharacterized protein n=1 Tax=Seminavis robusta TaxID=568900 RepID=A0A9N8DMP2_9STRA|nr:unknown protein [Seminavis robusta]|eukprot:Sro218_g089960.1 n/a (845) ;mRNA; r:4015-6549
MDGQQASWRRGGAIPDRDSVLKAAIKLWDKFMEFKYDNIGAADLAGDNSLVLLTELCTQWGENPPMKPNGQPYALSGLTKYIRTIIHDLKKTFGNNDAIRNGPELFTTEEVNQLVKMLEGNHGRTLMIGSRESDVFKESFPIPRQHSARTRTLPFNDFPNNNLRDMSRSVELFAMAQRLFTRGEFTKLCKLLFTFNGIGRGGEVKFLSYDKMFMCFHFNVLFMQWFQRKELKTNPSGFCMDFQYPELCIFFQLGCFWSVDNGLSRNRNDMVDPNSPRYRTAKFVFPDLHEIADDSVARQMTTLIRTLVPEQLKKFYSVKSLPTGAMSLLQWNSSVLLQEGIALGGWKTGANSDWYVWIYLVAIVPAVLALAGYPQPRIIPTLPDIELLYQDPDPNMVFSAVKLPDFINSLFVISLPEFQGPNGRLRNLLLVVVAVMIKNFRHCERKYGNGHPYVVKMIGATISSGLAVGNADGSVKLKHWSRKITMELTRAVPVMLDTNDNGLVANADGSVVAPGIKQELTMINHNLGELLRERNAMQQQLEANKQEIQSLKADMQDVKSGQYRTAGNQEEMMTSVRAISQSLAQLQLQPQRQQANPPPRQEPPPRQQQVRQPAQVVPPPALPPPPVAPTLPPPVALLQPPPPAPLVRNTLYSRLQRTRATDPGSNGRGKTKTESTVKFVMMDLYDSNHFRSLGQTNPHLDSLWSHVNTKFFRAERRHRNTLMLALRLVDCIWTSEERLASINGSFPSRDDALNAYHGIDLFVKRAVHIFSKPTNEKPNPRRKSALLGVGTSIHSSGVSELLKTFVPNWNAPQAPGWQTLRDYVVTKETELRNRRLHPSRTNHA